MSLYQLVDPGDPIAPSLVAAFDGWVDSGSAATTALGTLTTGARVVARFEADRLFDYRARRPTLDILDGRLTEIVWPELVLRGTRVGERDLLILSGPEPGAVLGTPPTVSFAVIFENDGHPEISVIVGNVSAGCGPKWNVPPSSVTACSRAATPPTAMRSP